MTTTDPRQAPAAELRRLAADAERHEHGDIAYRQYRLRVPGRGTSRKVSGGPDTQLRAVTERRTPDVADSKEFVHTSGYYTRYNRKYPMWDTFGMYHEWTAARSGARTLALKPEVAFLTNHGGTAMARTTSGTLELREDENGGFHDGWLNPERTDVHDLAIAIRDGDVPQMSFAFMIPDGGGYWSDDFTEFKIAEYDIDGGDVSAVNFGANPYTDITAGTEEVLNELDRLPYGAQREAMARLSRGGAFQAERAVNDAAARIADRMGESIGIFPREQITVRRAERVVDMSAGVSPMRRRQQGDILRTHARFVDLADQASLTVADLVSVRLPWYEIRAADVAPTGGDTPPAPESTDIYIFDEIGGSFGVDAATFVDELNAITTPKIGLHVNSPGGSVTEAMAIRSALMHHPSWITGSVDGIAASAASVIILGCDEIETMPGGQWMLHDASMKGDGNAAEWAKGSTFLDRQSGNIAGLYAQRMNVTTDVARAMMLAETWAFADEAVQLGLSDRVGERNKAKTPPTPELAERMARTHDLTRFGYRYTSRKAAPDPTQFRSLSSPSTERPVSAVRTGRSISLIEAQVAEMERS